MQSEWQKVRKNTNNALLLFALMWKDEKWLKEVETHLKKFYGNFVAETKPFELSYSKYYFDEMGSPLFKKFVITDYITDQINLYGIKKHTIFIEDKFRINGKRTVNVDPILVDTEKVLVATTKYRGNRIKIGEGVYLELELWFHSGEFKPFLWTYLDYKEHTGFFDKARKIFKKLLKS